MQQDPIVDENEVEHSHTLTIRVFTYGRREKTLMEVLRETGRAMHHAFGGNFEMEWGGNTVEYNAKAHDGEHLNETLIFSPKLLTEEPDPE